ncbi:hypothetical protein RIF29_33154 [Crotalaria pallida]|uniref:Uncharacterized protein n=1 Tax=Crotalaria pallida TaxID=3830 RepID=A0AAN9HSU0_CROPI
MKDQIPLDFLARSPLPHWRLCRGVVSMVELTTEKNFSSLLLEAIFGGGSHDDASSGFILYDGDSSAMGLVDSSVSGGGLVVASCSAEVASGGTMGIDDGGADDGRGRIVLSLSSLGRGGGFPG